LNETTVYVTWFCLEMLCCRDWSKLFSKAASTKNGVASVLHGWRISGSGLIGPASSWRKSASFFNGFLMSWRKSKSFVVGLLLTWRRTVLFFNGTELVWRRFAFFFGGLKVFRRGWKSENFCDIIIKLSTKLVYIIKVILHKPRRY